MEFFILELEGIWQFEILEAQNSDFFFFFLDQQLPFESNEIRFQNN
jgi:hypothetical protein